MRWMMAVTAYIAFLAAAIGTRKLVIMDLVWCVTLTAICYAIVVAVIDRGRRQAMAVGFLAFSAIHVVASYMHPESTPGTWLYRAAGYTVDSGEVYKAILATSGGANSYRTVRLTEAKGLVPHPRVANAVVTLVAGLIGCLIGALAYKHRDVKQEGL